MIRILLVDYQDILCETLKTSLETEPDLQIVGRANNAEIALEKTAILRPDIALIDINMLVIDGLTATKKIVQNFPETKVIILGGSEQESYRSSAMNVGANSYISKTAKAKEIIEQIRKVYRESHIGSPELKLSETIIQLNPAKRQIQSYVQQSHQKFNQFEHTEAEIKQHFGRLKNEQREVFQEIINFKSNVEPLLDDLRKTSKECKQHSTEISRLQTLVEGQLSYIHDLNKRIKYFRRYMVTVSVVAVIALIIAVISLLF
ncbi:MAG TPA: response regulator transcription factor [Coleofasciculaceae cyanobacterium]|jgi:DNA-binding NarL/FixJ family response regulator